MTKPLFPLGQLLSTPGALTAFEAAGQSPMEFVQRHVTGDWGDLCEEDKKLNDEAVKDSSRILSAYRLEKTGVKVWVITEAADDQGQRAATTCLLADEH